MAAAMKPSARWLLATLLIGGGVLVSCHLLTDGGAIEVRWRQAAPQGRNSFPAMSYDLRAEGGRLQRPTL